MKSNDWQGNRIASARRVSRVAIAVGVVAISVSACAARSESPGAEPGSAEKTLDAGEMFQDKLVASVELDSWLPIYAVGSQLRAELTLWFRPIAS